MVREEFDSTLIRRGRNALTFSDMAAFAQTVAERPLLKLLEELPELARLSETKFHLAEITLRQRFRREAPSDQLQLRETANEIAFASYFRSRRNQRRPPVSPRPPSRF
jgi:hypothetical protein